ncbi:unnamed protein product [Cyclocybe aegerita]|uniref:F-box domain-containing protein n=1 Tax=Cyclocybe aegerita TaxID=1973307 RepID=A0A8S0WKZ1_CYCAE|nr:unnamed protein product [Cyclocybe aegerita]
MSGGSPCTACEQLVLLDKKIKDTLNVLQQFQEAAFELKSQRNRQHDLLVNRLPTELLGRPLIRDQEKCKQPSWKTKSSTWRLSRVCRAWRDIIRCTRQLWTSIVVDVDEEDRGYAEFINDLFQRSGALPVWVKLYQPIRRYTSCSREGLPSPHTTRLLEIVNTHSGRWKSSRTDIEPRILQYVCGNPASTTCCLALFHGAQALTHLTLGEFWLDYDLPSKPSKPVVHAALRAFKIDDEGKHIGRLLDVLQLPSLEEMHIDHHNTDPLTDLITRSGCRLQHLTVKMPGDFDRPADGENGMIHLLEHTPSLLALALQTTFVTDLLFRRLGPPTREASPTSADSNKQGPAFLPLLHTLAIHVFLNFDFEWHSIANMFSPSADSLGSARQALKNFELQIYGKVGDPHPPQGSDLFKIEEDSAKRLLAVRENGINVTILDPRNYEMLVASDSISPSAPANSV